MGNAEDAAQRTRVRPARHEDVPALVEVMVAAFADDPVHHWLYPDAGTRPDVHRRLFAFLLRCGLRHGGVWTDTGLRGMALWVAPGEREMTDDETDVYLRMRREDMGERAGPVGEALWAIGASAPAEPFALLDFLAVHPDHQGQGLGTALATPVLDRCDADGASAWLVSSSPRNLSLYRRLGFRDSGTVQLAGGPPMWEMLRPASPRPAGLSRAPGLCR